MARLAILRKRVLAAWLLWIPLSGGTIAQAAELVEVVKKVEPAVVRIESDVSTGSGVVVGDQGFILTNYHVIDGARKVSLQLRNGTKLKTPGYLLIDPTHDLAILKTDGPIPKIALPLASDLPQVGEKVAAFGNPVGFSFSTSEGIVSAVRTGKEVEQSIGKDGYRGYALDATWIQTTAAISHGNSGGPLVTMNSELVGLNTWSYSGGQQLNFAISLKDIQRALSTISSNSPVHGYETLPRVRSTPTDGDSIAGLQPFRLELPTGRVFSFEVFRTKPATQLMATREFSQNGVVISHPNGTMFAAASQQGGILHGLTVAQYDNQEPMVQVTYQEGRRHGVLKTWDEAGEPMLFSQYSSGKRTGFTALFVESLDLIVQYKADQIEFVQLMSGFTPLEGFTTKEAALKHPKAKMLLERIDEIDAGLKKNEVQFRKQVREFEMDRRRELAAKLAPQKRARALERARDRKAENDAFIQGMRKRTHGF